jgi:hypothetical protein
MIFVLMASHGLGQMAEEEEVPDPGPAVNKSDGILEPGEIVDSTLLQTHMNPDRDPETDIISPDFVRDLVTARVESIKYLGSEQDTYLPWSLPLSSYTKKVGAKEQIRRYDLVKKKVPRYQYNYKYVTKTIYVRESPDPRPAASSSYHNQTRSGTGKLVKRRMRTKELESIRQVGWSTKKCRVCNPEGKYEEKSMCPIVELAGIAAYAHGWHAVNAQPVFTMLKSGLPGDDPQIQLTVDTLNNILNAYGIPDSTRDVAWLTALYANLPQEDPVVRDWTMRLASRLVAGASRFAPNTGLWGPVCVDPVYISKIRAYDAKFVEREIEPLKRKINMGLGVPAALAANPGLNVREPQAPAQEEKDPQRAKPVVRDRRTEKLEKELMELEHTYEKWQKVYLTWAMGGANAEMARYQTVIPAISEEQQNIIFNYSLRVPGLMQDPYHFQFTDLESTTLALFALAEVHAAGLLPKATLAPLDERGKALAPARDVQEVLSTSLETLRSLRSQAGGWNSCYSAVYHNACRDIDYVPLVPKDAYSKGKSEEHWSYRVMGLAALEYLARIKGGQDARQVRQESAKAHAEWIRWMLENEDQFSVEDNPAKEDLVYYLSDLLGARDPYARFLWQRLGSALLKESQDLPVLEQLDLFETSSTRIATAIEEAQAEAPKKRAIEVLGEPKMDPRASRLHRNPSLGDPSAAAYFLARGIREPVFAALKPEKRNSLCPALEHLMGSPAGLGLNYFHVPVLDGIEYYCNAFHLLVEPGEDFDPGYAQQLALREYIVNHKGTLVLLGKAGENREPHERIAQLLLREAGEVVTSPVAETSGYQGLEYRIQGRLAIVILDASQDKEPRETYSKRLKAYQALMKDKLPAHFLKPEYALRMDCVSDGELTLTGVEWEGADQNFDQ